MAQTTTLRHVQGDSDRRWHRQPTTRGATTAVETTGMTAPPATPAPSTQPTTWVLPALVLAAVVAQLSVAGLPPFLPVMADTFGVSVALLGQVPAIITLLAAGLGLAIGPLADWLGHRRALLLGLATIVLSTLGMALAPSLGILLAVALVGSIGRATIVPVAQALAGARFTGEERRRALGWLAAGSSGAGIAGVPILTSIDAALGWRAAFVGLALLVVAVLVLGRLAIAPDRADRTEPPRVGAVFRSYAPLFGHRPTLGLIGASALSAMGVWTMLTYLGAFYVQQHSFTTQQVGWAYLLIAISVVPGTLAAGGRLGRLPQRPLLVGSQVGLGLLMAAALTLPAPSAVAIGLMTVAGVMAGIGLVATSTLLTEETPAGRATTMVLNRSAISLGTAVGSATGGLLLALSGYGALGASTLLWCGASAALIWWSRSPAPARLPVAPAPAGD
jgi:DHA1 family purine base/nucleoside efflux pump-like MFS transporter